MKTWLVTMKTIPDVKTVKGTNLVFDEHGGFYVTVDSIVDGWLGTSYVAFAVSNGEWISVEEVH